MADITFEGFEFNVSGSANWYVQAVTYNTPPDALQGGNINDSQETRIDMVNPGTGDLSFYRKVSSESNYDKLRFYINGIEQEAISGEVNWAQKTYAIDSGDTIYWRYTKDSSVSRGSDTGFLDTFVFTPYSSSSTSFSSSSVSSSSTSSSSAAMTDYILPNSNISFTLSGPGGSGIGSSGNGKWNWRSTTTGSSNTGPSVPPPGPDAYYWYTETSSTSIGAVFTMTLNDILDSSIWNYTINFFYSNYGTAGGGECLVQYWNGSSWITVQTIGWNNFWPGPWIAATPIDLSAFDNADGQIRWQFTTGGATTYANDFGLDWIRLIADPASSSSSSVSSSSSSVSSSTSLSSGTWTWGQQTGVTTDYILTFANGIITPWIADDIEGSGDAERIVANSDGSYIWSEPAYIGINSDVHLNYNEYAGSRNDSKFGAILFRTGATRQACLATGWQNYDRSVPMNSLGWIQFSFTINSLSSSSVSSSSSSSTSLNCRWESWNGGLSEWDIAQDEGVNLAGWNGSVWTSVIHHLDPDISGGEHGAAEYIYLVPKAWSINYRPFYTRVTHNRRISDLSGPNPRLQILTADSSKIVDEDQYISDTVVSMSGGSWVPYFDNTKWNEATSQGFWTGSQWDAAPGKSGYGLGLRPLGGWEVGFRPSKVRVTYNVAGSLTLDDTDFVDIVIWAPYTSLDEVDITWASADLRELFVGDSLYFSITNIEFFSGVAGDMALFKFYHTGATPMEISNIEFCRESSSSSSTSSSSSSTPAQTTYTWGESGNEDFSGVTQDAMMRKQFPAQNYGSYTTYHIFNTFTDARGLMKYDVSALSGLITYSSQIVSAKLYVQSTSINGGDIIIDAHRILREWNQGNKNSAQATIGEMTWSSAKYLTELWGTEGCDNTTNDRLATISDTAIANASFAWYNWDVTVDVKAFFNGTINYGWILKVSPLDTGVASGSFADSRYTAASRPYLEIEINVIASSSSISSSSSSTSSSSSSSSSSTSVAPIIVNLIGGPDWGGTVWGGWHKDIIDGSGSVNTLFHDGPPVPASPNRCVVATICARLNTQSNPTQATLVTLGGRTLTKIFEVNEDDRTFNSIYMWTGYLLEADIALMVGATFAVTWSNQPDEGTQFAYSGYENVDQVTPILDFNSNSNPNTKTVTTGSYTYGGDDQPIIIAMASRASDGLHWDATGYTYTGLNFQYYGYDEQSGTGSPSNWSSRLQSKTYHNVGATENWTATINNFAGMIAGVIVLKAG